MNLRVLAVFLAVAPAARGVGTCTGEACAPELGDVMLQRSSDKGVVKMHMTETEDPGGVQKNPIELVEKEEEAPASSRSM